MAFIVEDGTGLSTATAYISAQDMRDYWAAVGTTFAQSDSVLQSAIVAAMRYVEGRYRGKFKGAQLNPAIQALSFPRICIYDPDGNLEAAVPSRLKDAISEYSSRALTSPLAPDPSIAPNVAATKEVVGPIEEDVTFFGAAPIFAAYPAADLLLQEFLRGNGQARSYR